MGNLIGLPGVKNGVIEDVKFFQSIEQGMRALRTDRAVTAAADYGAVTVYKDDDDNFRCLFSVHGTDLDDSILTTKKAVKDWLRKFFPKCKNQKAAITFLQERRAAMQGEKT